VSGRDGQVRIRPLGPEDAGALHVLRLAALEANPEAFLRHVDEERAGGIERQRARLEANAASGGEATLFGAFEGDDLVGMLGLIRDADRKRRHRAVVVAVYVAPERRGRGLAGRLLDAALARARTLPGIEIVYLSAAAGNEPALALYRSRGFEVWGVEPDYLRVDGRPHDEVHLLRRLDPSDR
jgi:RimJ/RimL family protein N-acetyltransferase